jgi:hypothetical protein
MNPFGRQQSRSWPKRWGWSKSIPDVLLVAFGVGAAFQYQHKWTSLQRYYLPAYVETWALPYKRASEYQGIFLVKGRSKWLATDADIELMEEQANGSWLAAIASTDKAAGWKQWNLLPADTNSIKSGDQLHRFLANQIYRVQSGLNFGLFPAYCALAVGAFWIIFALPRDLKLNLEYKYGRRLRGPQLVNARQYHKLMGRPDGLGFLNLHQSVTERFLFPRSSNCVHIPRAAEPRHLLLLGDTGTGKSSTIRQILNQIAERGDSSAIIYDPAREYVRHYFDPGRGDIVLNPLDGRCPAWMPGDEIGHPAEADMLAESVFPIADETPLDKRFFFTAAREVLVELLKLNPTPAQLYRWMCDEEEMIRLLRGTPVISQIAEKSPGQRSGVFGTLTQAAKMFEFLPDEAGRPRWSARKWAERRQGWIFLTSLPMLRGRLRPLITLWIEQLLLRIMNDEEPRRQTYFILDELASLPRIEQLVHALFEARKAYATIVVSLQGKAQQDVKYGRIAQAMVSMAATKILMGTSEPEAARWISDAIGEVEIERYRASRTENHGSGTRNSDGFQCEIVREPLVMGPQIMGLPSLHAYLRHGNFVVPIRMPFIPAEKHHPGFIRRSLPAPAEPAPPTTDATQPPQIVATEQMPEPDKDPEQAHEYF